MKLGLQIPNLTWSGGSAEMGSKLAEIGRTAEEIGYSSLWLMDHYFQIFVRDPAEWDMIEAYTALGYIAAHTSKVKLGTLVTGVTYRHPGVLAKQVTTLDVLSGGRAYLGIGAAWFEREHIGLGVPFPPLKERFQRLEEALRISLQMWSDDNGPFEGKHYQLAETINVPQALSKPHPPILIGGSGEKKTLRLVAKYADACNMFGDPPTIARKLAILREHCANEDRDYNAIEKTVYYAIDLGEGKKTSDQVVQELGAYAEAGVQAAIGGLTGVEHRATFDVVGRDIIPQVAKL